MENLPHEIHGSEGEHGTVKTYVIGLILCLFLTLGSYYLVSEHILSGKTLIYAICALGLTQAFIQLHFFLHLGTEPKPYWDFSIFLFMALVLLIVVIGSLWIMENLDYRTMNDMKKFEGVF